MSERRLQVFYSVAKHLSFTKAAGALHMTQPAVTFQVRQLEEQYNSRLFDRTHNHINLTRAGERVYDYARQIFELYSRMEGEVRALTGEVSAVVILGASTTIAEYMLPSPWWKTTRSISASSRPRCPTRAWSWRFAASTHWWRYYRRDTRSQASRACRWRMSSSTRSCWRDEGA